MSEPKPPAAHGPATGSASYAQLLASIREVKAEINALVEMNALTTAERDLPAIPQPRAGRLEPAQPQPPSRSLDDRLLSCGLPEQVLEALPDRPHAGDLFDLLSRLPQAPRPLPRAGFVMVFVGTADLVHRNAAAEAKRLRVPLSRIVRVGPAPGQRPQVGSKKTVKQGVSEYLTAPVTTWEQARRAGAAARLSPDPVIFAVESSCAPRDLGYTVEALNALDGDLAFACLDAGRKSADTARWLGRLREGAVLHAVTVDKVAGTSDPGTVFAAGLPIAEVDGERLEAAGWLTLLLGEDAPSAPVLARIDPADHRIGEVAW